VSTSAWSACSPPTVDLCEHDDTILVGEPELRRGRKPLLGELGPQRSDLVLAEHGAADRAVAGRYPLDVVLRIGNYRVVDAK
jgi:hypothetical protein